MMYLNVFNQEVFFLTFKKTLRSSKAEQDIIQYKFHLHKKKIAHWPQISINWRSETPDKTKKRGESIHQITITPHTVFCLANGG